MDKNPEQHVLIPRVPSRIVHGKDELNFAEFPLGVLAARAPEGQKLLSFKRKVIDRETRKPVTRELRITAPPDATLPTSTDDEVVLALIQLSKLQKFKSRKIYFTRYQLIQILKWKRNGQNYKRLSESLDRLARVDYRYLNAWFDKLDGRWKDATFQIIDSLVIDPRENEKSKARQDPRQGEFEFASSWFTWSEVVFESLQVGFIKTLNYDFATSLKSKTTFRLFRFLDKRFWYGPKLKFDLRQLGYEHIGISRNSPLKQVKREVKKSILELEDKGYLKSMPESDRFQKKKVGEWTVMFEQSEKFCRNEVNGSDRWREQELPIEEIENLMVVQELTQRGINETKAIEIARNSSYPLEFIQEKIEVFDWMASRNDPRVSKNQAGYLVSSIETPYETPGEFQTKKDGAGKEAKSANQKKKPSKIKKEKTEINQAEVKCIRADLFWKSLSSEEIDFHMKKAFEVANDFEKPYLKGNGELAESIRKKLLDKYALENS